MQKRMKALKRCADDQITPLQLTKPAETKEREREREENRDKENETANILNTEMPGTSNTKNTKKRRTNSNTRNSEIEVEPNVKPKRGQTKLIASPKAVKKVDFPQNANNASSENISRGHKRKGTFEGSSQSKKSKMESSEIKQNKGGRPKKNLNNLQSKQDKEPVKENKTRAGESAEIKFSELAASSGITERTRGNNKTSGNIQPRTNVRSKTTQAEVKTKGKRPTQGKQDSALNNIDSAKKKPEQAEKKTARQQKASEPENRLAGRTRKNTANGSKPKEPQKPARRSQRK